MNSNNLLDSSQLNGWIILDKEKDISSAQVLNLFKKKLKVLLPKQNIPKIGHGGTLDPLATGALGIALGEATKTVPYVMDKPKTYVFSIKFGIETPSYDLGTPIIKEDSFFPTKEALTKTLCNFIGEIKQQPPIYSALKVNGKRAYKYARSQQEVKLTTRNVIIYELKLLSYKKKLKTVTFLAKISKGTYIRSLANDIAKSVKSIGTVSYLRRILLGSFQEKPLLLSKFLYNKETSLRTLLTFLYPIDQILDDILVINCSHKEVKAILNGNTTFLESSFFKGFNNGVYKAIYKNRVFSIIKIVNGVAIILRNFNNLTLEKVDVD